MTGGELPEPQEGKRRGKSKDKAWKRLPTRNRVAGRLAHRARRNVVGSSHS